MELLVAGFLAAHGLIHGAIYGIPKPADGEAPFDPSSSWALAAAGVRAESAKAASVALAMTSTVLFMAAAAGLALDAGWWPKLVVVAAGVAAAFKIVYFHPWLTLGVLLDVGIVAAVGAQWPASVF